MAGKLGTASRVAQPFSARGNVSYTVSRQNPVTVTLAGPLPEVTDTAEGLSRLVTARPSAWSGTDGVLLKQLGVMRGEKIFSLVVRPYDFNPGSRQLTYYKTVVVSLSSSQAFPADFDQPYVNFDRRPTGRITSSAQVPASTYIRIVVNRDGIYHITGNDLDTAGVSISGFTSRNMTLWNHGKQVPIYVYTPGGTQFTKDSYFEFYGTENRVDYSNGRPDMYLDPYTDENVYFLTDDSAASPQRLVTESGALDRVSNAIDLYNYSFTQTTHIEQDKIFERLPYVDLNQNSDRRDHWFWTEVSSNQMVTVPFNLAYPDTTNIQPLTLTAAFHGITQFDSVSGVPNVPNENQAELFINQTHVLSTSWNGQTLRIAKVGADASIPQNVLHNGANTIQIYNANPGNVAVSTFAFNWIELKYQRLYVADKDYLKFTVPDNARPGYYNFLIQHFQNPSISVYRLNNSKITDVTIKLLNNRGTAQGYAAMFQAYVQSPDDQFIAVSDAGKLKPLRIEQVPNIGLSSHDYSADYIMITNRKLDDLTQGKQDPSNPISQLAAWYDSHGTKTLVVDAAEVYDAFNYGIESPYAIRDFISYAYHNWNVPPRYVLLAGSGTWNTKTGGGSNLIPAMMVQTYNFGATASDNFYACVDGNDPIPDVAIGRIPASNADQMKTAVDKILSYYSNTTFGWQNTATLIAGEEEEFHLQTDSVAKSMISPGVFVKRLYTSIQDPAVDTKYYGVTQNLIDDFNRGTLFINYMGHGGGAIWADNGILTNNEVANLSNSGKYPFVASMTCFTAAFDGQIGLPLTSTLLFAKDKGAVSALGSAGLGWMYNDFFMDGELLPMVFDSLTSGNGIGWNIALAKARYYASYFFWPQAVAMLNQYNLIGDPALKLQLPPNNSTVRLDSYTTTSGQSISGTISNAPAGGSGVVQITNLGGDVAAQANVTLDKNGSCRFSIPTPAGISGVSRVKAYTYNSSAQSVSSVDFSTGNSYAAVSSLGITSDGAGFRVSIVALASANAGMSSLKFLGKVFASGNYNQAQAVASLSIPLEADGANEYSAAIHLGADTLKPGYVIVGGVEASLSNGDTLTSPQVAYTVPGAADLSAFSEHGFPNVNPSIKVVADSVVRLEGTVYDWNSVPAKDVRVDYYDGPRQTGTFLGSARVSFDSTTQALASIPTDLLSGSHTVYMYIVFDSLTTGYDLHPENDYASANISVDFEAANSSGVVRIDTAASLSGASPGEIFQVGRVIPALYNQPFTVTAKDKGGSGQFYRFVSLKNGETGTYHVSLKILDPDSTTSSNLSGLHLYLYDPKTRTLNLAGGSYSAGSVGGTVSQLGTFTAAFSTDRTPPEVTISVGDQFFTNGDFVPPQPRFSFLIQDEDGVDLSRKALDVELDGQMIDPSLITVPDSVANPTSVTATVALPVKTGSHKLQVTAEDANGNVSNPVSADFVVRSDFSLRVYGAYPDPFVDKTFIAFEVTSGNPIEGVEIKIYSVSGRLVKTIRYPSSNPMESLGLLQGGTGSPTAVGYHEAWWDGTDNYGNQVANGVYFYKVTVRSGGKTLEYIGKMARLR